MLLVRLSKRSAAGARSGLGASEGGRIVAVVGESGVLAAKATRWDGRDRLHPAEAQGARREQRHRLIRHHAAGDRGRRERCPAALVIMI
jgi:hypothetical protein